MTRFHILPQNFAFVRTRPYRGPSFQVFLSRTPAYRHERHDYNILEDYTPLLQHHYYALQPLHSTQFDRSLFRVRCENPETGAIIETYFWYLPYLLVGNGQRLPILEFHLRSWVPRSHEMLQVEAYSMNEFLHHMERIQSERLEQMRRMEDEEAGPSHFGRGILDYFRGYGGYDDHDDRNIHTPDYVGVRRSRYSSRPATPPPVPQPRIIEVPVERIVERVVVRTQPAALPKNVGDVLLSHARKGADSCPIAATPFSECTRLCVTSCFHIFDWESLERWREDHSTCPVCRSTIENVVSETRVDGLPTV